VQRRASYLVTLIHPEGRGGAAGGREVGAEEVDQRKGLVTLSSHVEHVDAEAVGDEGVGTT